MTRYGMAIDLDRCIGCHACTVACIQERLTPLPIRNTRVIQVDGRFPGDPMRMFVPLSCMHCARPPCVEVCPTGATFRSAEGIVIVDASRCNGCSACVVACPYGARQIVESRSWYFGDVPTPLETVLSAQGVQGTVVKCDFCAHRLEAGMLPACVETCPTNARHFGDLEEPTSEVARLREEERAAVLGAEYGTLPSVFYLLPRKTSTTDPSGA